MKYIYKWHVCLGPYNLDKRGFRKSEKRTAAKDDPRAKGKGKGRGKRQRRSERERGKGMEK